MTDHRPLLVLPCHAQCLTTGACPEMADVSPSLTNKATSGVEVRFAVPSAMNILSPDHGVLCLLIRAVRASPRLFGISPCCPLLITRVPCWYSLQ
ncbi:hypothetical protein OH77DRAFT_1419878 [Trametes cingulata]|nr:hypothetical protein OH77DRAFT_1419878 [Trametes cingulata]